MDKNKPLKEVDLTGVADSDLLLNSTKTPEQEMTEFAQTLSQASDGYWSKFKMESDMQALYANTQKYSKEDTIRIIYGTDSQKKAELSTYYYNTNTMYKFFILYYASILTYDTLVVPNYNVIDSKVDSKIEKMYQTALSFMDYLGIKSTSFDIMKHVFREGVYFGLVRYVEDGVTMQQLPREWCKVGAKDAYGNAIYFIDLMKIERLNIVDRMNLVPGLRSKVLDGLPENVRKGYDKYIGNRTTDNRYFKITATQGICVFEDPSTNPMFVNVIEDIIAFQEQKRIDYEKSVEELSKLITHQIPLNKDGNPILTTPEAKAFHKGLVTMFAGNRYVDTVTSFGEIKVESIQTAGAVQDTRLTKMAESVYDSSTLSKEIFSAAKNTGMEKSIIKDTSIVYNIALVIESWLNHQVNTMIQIAFKKQKYARFFEVSMLFLSHYNRENYIKIFKDLAMSGYSKILPYVAIGVKQSNLTNLIRLEKSLNLVEELEPLKSSYTQTGEESESGAPVKEDAETSGKTIENKNST